MAEARRLRDEPDTEAEEALLAMALSDPDTWPSILARVRPEDCGNVLIGRLFRFAAEQAARGVLVGLAELSGQVEVGERPYLRDLRTRAPLPATLPMWAGRVTERSQRRRLHSLAWHVRNLATEGETSAAEIAATATRELAEIVAPGLNTKILAPDQWLERWRADLDRRRDAGDALGLPTGIPSLDRDIIVEPGHMVLVAAETGVGKTAFGLSVALTAASAGHSVFYANTEMDVEAMAARLIAARSGVALHELRRGLLTPEQYAAVDEATAVLRESGLHISEPLAGTNPEAIAHVARARRAEGGCDVLVVDYVGRLDIAPGQGEREWNVLERVAARMKALAVELRCAVYLLVQRTEDGTIAGSRRMKNDADLVLEITRKPEPEPDRRGNTPPDRWPSATHLIGITKTRHAGGFVIAANFDAAHMTWREVGRS